MSISTISELQPQPLWKMFHALTQIPRPSKHEQAALEFIESLCKQKGLEHFYDQVGNFIIRKPATQGYENCQGVIMQGHIDMVPQKAADSCHDFLTDPITTYIEGDWVSAQGTTLGADNGLGVAAALAVIFSDDIEHGPLEVLITIDEETGMTGAKGLQAGDLQGDILLNLDTEDEGELYIGCAGGVDISANFNMETCEFPENHDCFEIRLFGLRGGHSGLDIDGGRGNAIKLLSDFLLNHTQVKSHGLYFNGGTLRNAIARDAIVGIAIDHSDENQLKQDISKFLKEIEVKFKNIENTIQITVTPIAATSWVYTQDAWQSLLTAIDSCIHGVTAMSNDFNGIVQTSNNLAVINTTETSANVLCLARSLSDENRDTIAQDIKKGFEAHKAQVQISGEYPGWQPNPNSKILNIMCHLYEQYFHAPAKIKVIHAGLECGLLGKPYPEWDMISMGPTIRHAHSPDEMVNIPSVEKFWQFLLFTLKNIPRS